MPKLKSSPTSVASTAPAAKKARKSDSISTPPDELLLLNHEQLKDLPVEKLVSHFTALQDAYHELENMKSIALNTASSNIAKPEDDAEKVKEKSCKIADMMAVGIKKQMKWQLVFLSFPLLSN
jgi:hypothetical protein